jgi:hypothetical protein
MTFPLKASQAEWKSNPSWPGSTRAISWSGGFRRRSNVPPWHQMARSKQGEGGSGLAGEHRERSIDCQQGVVVETADTRAELLTAHGLRGSSQASAVARSQNWASSRPAGVCSCAAIARLWRRASAAKLGALVSGTQIWIGRRPAAHILSRRRLTLSALVGLFKALHVARREDGGKGARSPLAAWGHCHWWRA